MEKGIKTKEQVLGKVIDLIVATAGSQLIITKPSEESATDLIIEKRGEYYNERKVYLQIRECEKNLTKGVYRAEISEEELRTRENTFLIFVYFDQIIQDIVNVWLVPVAIFPKIAQTLFLNQKKVLIFETPIDARKANQFSKFLVQKDNLLMVLRESIK